MSNFDFKKLREQTKTTGELLKNTFKATDNQLIGIAQRDADPTYQKGQKERAQTRSDEWRKKKTDASRKLAEDPIWQANQKVGAEKRRESLYDNEEKKKAATLKRESNQKYKEERALRNRSQINDPIYQANHAEGIAQRDADPKYQKAFLLGVEEKLMRKGFIVTPAGIHLRQTESATANNISVSTLQKRIKNNKTEYYYISKEEYTQLTGKEL